MNAEITIMKPEEGNLKQNLIPIKEYSDSLKAITKPEEYEEAGTYILMGKTIEAKIKEYFDPDIKKANELHKSLTGKKKVFIDALHTCTCRIENKMLEYKAEERRKIAIAEAEALEKQRRIDEIAEAKAKKLLKNGEIEKAQAVLENRPQVPVNIPAPAKINGISTRRTWKADVIDLKKYIRAAIKMPNPESYLLPNHDTLDALAKAMKAGAKMDGVRFYEDETIIRR